jgi:hypothetical protein
MTPSVETIPVCPIMGNSQLQKRWIKKKKKKKEPSLPQTRNGRPDDGHGVKVTLGIDRLDIGILSN